MNRQEIDEFIEKMEEIGDEWDPEDVERVYGDDSLQDALDDRMGDMMQLGNVLGTVYNYARNLDD